MLDFSLAELLLVVVVAVVFIGPKELPVVLRAIVKAVRAIRTMGRQVQQMVDELMDESGVKDVSKTLKDDLTFIRGDDGQLYESYDLSKVTLPKAEEKAPPEQPEEAKPV